MRVFLLIALACMTRSAAAQSPSAHTPGGVLLFDQTDLVTGTGTGAGGANESAVQTSLGLVSAGFNHNAALGISVADDFTVPAGASWTVDHFVFYAYQLDSPLDANTSSIFEHFVRIWNGPPGSPSSTVVAGDLTTNVQTARGPANLLRVLDTDAPGSSTRRRVFTGTATLTTPARLQPGTYWVEWQATGSLPTAVFTPPVTRPGQTTTGNALTGSSSTSPFTPVVDAGTSTPQGLPFQVYGVVGVGTEETPAGATRLTIAPNPLIGSGHIEVTAAAAGNVRVTLCDALGREVANLLDRAMTPGQTATIEVSTQGLPPGVYTVRATGAGPDVAQRVSIVR